MQANEGCLDPVIREMILEHNRLGSLVFASLTGYMLTSFGFPILNYLWVDSMNFSKTTGNFPAVLMNFNRLILKLNRFICTSLPVLPDHSLNHNMNDNPVDEL
jgi:hypothetical protein